MKKITFDTGIEKFQLPGGVLQFNPADPGVYARFAESCEQLQQLEQDMAAQLSAENADVLAIMAQVDKAVKQSLGRVFGPGNDMDALLGGVNLLASAADGRPVIEHFLQALEPVLLEGAKRCARAQAAAMHQ